MIGLESGQKAQNPITWGKRVFALTANEDAEMTAQNPLTVVDAIVAKARAAQSAWHDRRGGSVDKSKGDACERLIARIHSEFAKYGETNDIVQMVPAPGSKEKTQRVLEISDMIVVTGSQNNVRQA